MKAFRDIRPLVGCMLLSAVAVMVSCTEKPAPVVNKYPTLPLREVPDYLADTILQYTDMSGTEPYPVSGFGLVANLDETGGSHVATTVRDFMIKEIGRHRFETYVGNNMDAEQILNSKRFATVRVDGFIPPGARAGTDWSTWFDVRVSVPPGSDAVSLVRGDLYESDLRVGGANTLDPGTQTVAVLAQAMGPIFINPTYALDDSADTPTARSSRRAGVVLGGARVMDDRPLILRLRAPERRMARSIENRIVEQFQGVVDNDLRIKHVASAQDEGLIYVYVPRVYTDDWSHFANLLKHLYMRGGSPEYAALKAQQLADAAVKPDAPLDDISFAWEGLGKPAMHALTPLMNSSSPDVQFAAARAAAFIGDPGAVPVLMRIASTPGNSFRVNAVQTLAQLPATPMVDKLLRTLLDSDQALVRIEAYKVLAKHQDGSVYSRIIKNGDNEKFVLDMVHCNGSPLVYASRQGIPRLAIFGTETEVTIPIMYAAMTDRFSISSNPDNADVTIFYRGTELQKPVKIISGPQLSEIAARLGGDGPPGDDALDFSYADVVALMQSMIDGQKVSRAVAGRRQLAAFVLQEPPRIQDAIDSAPLLGDNGRPQTESSGPTTAPAAQTGGVIGMDSTK
jgi:flagellar basal body P-ring protein FlgI